MLGSKHTLHKSLLTGWKNKNGWNGPLAHPKLKFRINGSWSYVIIITFKQVFNEIVLGLKLLGAQINFDAIFFTGNSLVQILLLGAFVWYWIEMEKLLKSFGFADGMKIHISRKCCLKLVAKKGEWKIYYTKWKIIKRKRESKSKYNMEYKAKELFWIYVQKTKSFRYY